MSVLEAENAITVVRGTTKTLKLQVNDSDGVAVDITGARVVFTVKCRISDVDNLLQKDSSVSSAQADITAPLAGAAEIYILPADTKALTPGTYIFDVLVELTGGDVHQVVGPGKFTIVPSVTVLS